MSGSDMAMVVEDEPQVRDLFCRWMEQYGFEAIGAGSGEEAIQQWCSDLDIVLLDLRMPDIDGYEVLEEVRKEYQTPVIVVTAVEPDVEIVDMEFDSYLTKPVDTDELKTTIQDVLSVTAVREEVREFIQVGVKIEKFQSRNSANDLAAHAEFNKLKRQYTELLNQMKMMDLSDNEKDLLRSARNELSEMKAA